jgi:WD40 repeat protein
LIENDLVKQNKNSSSSRNKVMKNKISQFPALSLAVAAMLSVFNAPFSTLAAPFELFVTQSPPGPQNTDPANWSGVLQFHLTANGGVLNPGGGIDKTNLDDPAGLGFRPATSELFVGNRWGNSSPSSISRFIYDPVTRRLIPNGTITGNSLFGVHQITFSPVTGEMFAANFGNGVSRFTFDTNGTALANGVIGSGSMRGVAVSPDGLRLYASSVSSVIRQFDLTTGAELAGVIVPSGVGGLHFFQVQAGRLYVAAPSDNCVYCYLIGTNDDLTLVDAITNTLAAIAVTLSPDGQDMFVSGHKTSDLIYRFAHNPQNDTWTDMGTVDTGSSLGGILAIPSGPQPDITLTATNSAVVAWCSVPAGWNLQVSTNLATTNWITPPETVQDNGTNKYIIVNPPDGNRFFRLSKQRGRLAIRSAEFFCDQMKGNKIMKTKLHPSIVLATAGWLENSSDPRFREITSHFPSSR